MKTVPRKVDPLRNVEDMEVLIMGSLGLSTKAIQARTGFSECQITYRLNKEEVRRMDYRNGESAIAKKILKNTHRLAEGELRQRIRRHHKMSPQ